MEDILIQNLPEAEITSRGIKSWPVWEKEVSRFPWTYDSTEECLILEGILWWKPAASRFTSNPAILSPSEKGFTAPGI